MQKRNHALNAWLKIENTQAYEITKELLRDWLNRAVQIESSVTEKISASRRKDYTNPFRKMMYVNENEMNDVLGKFSENEFILEKEIECTDLKKRIIELTNYWRL